MYIDISEHNGSINFDKVQNQIEGAILRIGWIGNKSNHTIDKRFEEYYSECIKRGIKVGIYVYSYCKSVDTVIDGLLWLLKKLNHRHLDLPIFLDLEDNTIENCDLTNQAIEFCKNVEINGYKSGIYASKYWFTKKIDVYKLENYKIWLAEWNGKENPTVSFKVDLWQYTSDGKINGIKSRVDLNKCLCNCNEKPINNGGDYEMKIYKNGSTKEIVYQDCNCTKKIGYLNPREVAECYGIINNKAVVVYKIDGTNNKKVGFVKWLGGLK